MAFDCQNRTEMRIVVCGSHDTWYPIVNQNKILIYHLETNLSVSPEPINKGKFILSANVGMLKP